MPLISIIITSFNQYEYLKKCVLSVLDSTYPNLEIILIDDSSKKGEFNKNEIDKIIKKTARNNIKNYEILVNEKNLGHANSLNRCIEIAKGIYFVYVNGDDLLPANSLELLLQEHRRGDFILIGGQIASLSRDGKIFYPSFDTPELLKLPQREILNKIMLEFTVPFPLPGSLIKTSQFNKLDKFEKNFSYLEDWQFFIKVFYKNLKVSFINEITYIHRNYSGVLATNGRFENYRLSKDFFDAINWIFKNFNLDSTILKKLRASQSFYELRYKYFSIEKTLSLRFMFFIIKNPFNIIKNYIIYKFFKNLD